MAYGVGGGPRARRWSAGGGGHASGYDGGGGGHGSGRDDGDCAVAPGAGVPDPTLRGPDEGCETGRMPALDPNPQNGQKKLLLVFGAMLAITVIIGIIASIASP